MSGERIRLEVTEREQLGSRVSRRLRKQGLVPGVLYGKGAPHAFTVPARELRGALSGPGGRHTILDVVLAGKQTTHPSILKDFQRDLLRGTVTHIDLHEVRLDRPIQATVSVHLVGEAPGTKVGGVLTQIVRDVTVEALPMGIPEHIDLDISGLEIGDSLRVEDLPALEGVTYLDDPHETVLATVAVPRVEVEEVEEEAAEVEAVEGEAAAGEAVAEAAEGAPEAGEPESTEA